MIVARVLLHFWYVCFAIFMAMVSRILRDPTKAPTRAKRLLVVLVIVNVFTLLFWAPAAVLTIMSGFVASLLVWSYPLVAIVCCVVAYRKFKQFSYKAACWWASVPVWIIASIAFVRDLIWLIPHFLNG